MKGEDKLFSFSRCCPGCVITSDVKLVVVTVNLVSVMGTPFLVSAISPLVGNGLAPSGRDKKKWKREGEQLSLYR